MSCSFFLSFVIPTKPPLRSSSIVSLCDWVPTYFAFYKRCDFCRLFANLSRTCGLCAPIIRFPPVHVVSSKENRIFSPRMSTIYTYTRANSRLHINAYYSSIIGSFVAKPQHTCTRVQWFFSDLQNGIFYRLPESLQRLSVNDAHPWSQNYTRRQRENVPAFP